MPNPNDQKMTAVRSRHVLLSSDVLICFILFVITLITFRLSDLDMALQRSFFLSDNGWHLGELPFPQFIYHYSNLPALALALTGLVLFGISFSGIRHVKWRRIGLFLLLVLGIGPGLIVNSLLKDQWGRPRPRNIIEFEGKYAYEPLLTMDATSTGNSFPSGHASMGFYLFVPWFFLRSRRRLFAYALLAFGIGAGALIGYIRMIQGGHFASDVVIAGLVVYLTAFALYRILGLHRNVWYIPQPGTAP